MLINDSDTIAGSEEELDESSSEDDKEFQLEHKHFLRPVMDRAF